jgi:TonB family protein
MRCVVALLFLFFSGQVLAAQQQPALHTVTEAEARQHLLQHNDPIYPPIAQAARVEGDVEIEIVVDVTGRIVSETIASGPPMLRPSALDAVKQWTFTPFQADGAPVRTSATLTIPFHLKKIGSSPSAAQEKAAQEWFPLSDKCRNSLRTQNTQESLDACKQALDMSLKAGDLTSSDQLAMLESYQAYGHALLAAGKLQEALATESKAVEIAKAHLKDTDQEYAMPFFWRALAEQSLGQGDAALADFDTAEEVHRKAIVHLPEMKKMYSRYLASILRQHAASLEGMGRPADAAKLRAEAASYSF